MWHPRYPCLQPSSAHLITLHSTLMKSEPVCGQEAIPQDDSSIQRRSSKNEQSFFSLQRLQWYLKKKKKVCLLPQHYNMCAKPSLKKPNVLKLYVSLNRYQTIPKCRRNMMVFEWSLHEMYERSQDCFIQRRGHTECLSLLPPEVCDDSVQVQELRVGSMHSTSTARWKPANADAMGFSPQGSLLSEGEMV